MTFWPFEMFWLKLHQICYQRVLTGLPRSYTILAADRSMNLSLSFQTSLSTAQAFIFFEEISTWLSHGSCVREHDEKDACVQRKNRNGGKNTWSAIVDCIIRVEVKRAESGDVFPSFFSPSFLIMSHYSAWQIYVDAIHQWVAYQAVRESRDF